MTLCVIVLAVDTVWWACEYFPKEGETCRNDQIRQGVICVKSEHCVNRDIRLLINNIFIRTYVMALKILMIKF